MLTHDRLTELLDYNKDTGFFTWKLHRYRYAAGTKAGSCNKGRIYIELDSQCYTAARLAFFYVTKEWPKGQIDHINCVKDDNRWCNLRDCTQSQNQANRPARKNKKVPLKGVVLRKKLPKPYLAQICANGKTTHLGCYSTAEEAHKAYCRAAQELHGKFWRG